MEKHPFAPGDIVASKNSGLKGVVRSVGQVGQHICAMVTWFDTKQSSFIPLRDIRKTLRGIDGGKERDPDT